MFSSILRVTSRTLATPAAVLAVLASTAGSVRAADPVVIQRGPKNLMSLTYRAPAVPAVELRELSRRDAKKLAATAKSSEDHLTLASYYGTKADRLEAEAAAYEEASAALRRAPAVKNLTAPGTAARYRNLAEAFREEAKSDRILAASEMAKTAD